MNACRLHERIPVVSASALAFQLQIPIAIYTYTQKKPAVFLYITGRLYRKSPAIPQQTSPGYQTKYECGSSPHGCVSLQIVQHIGCTCSRPSACSPVGFLHSKIYWNSQSMHPLPPRSPPMSNLILQLLSFSLYLTSVPLAWQVFGVV